MKKNNRKRNLFLTSILVVILIVVIGSVVYVSNYYHATKEASDSLQSTQNVTVTVKSNDRIVFEPQDSKIGFIFYPGGKVEYTAYAPLLERLAEQGILCVLVKMPANLAVLNKDAADGIIEEYPSVTSWYIGGHSLGGAMAASYVKEHTKQYDGLILLAAYSTADLSSTDLDVLTIYGSNDKVMNCDKQKEYSTNLPSDAQTVILEGGNHAYFGFYGEQDKDGEASITHEEQINQTVTSIINMLE